MDLRDVRALQNFIESLDNKESLEKTASKVSGYIKTKVREDGFARRVLPPENVTPAECQVAEDHDGLVKVVRLEPEVGGMVLTWRGQPTPKYLEANRAFLHFHNIASEEVTKTEQELYAYGGGIEQILEQLCIKGIHKQEDNVFMNGVNAAIAINGSTIGPTGAEFDQTDIKNLQVMLADKDLQLTTLLMSYKTFAVVNTWDASELGDNIRSEVTVNGYKYPTLLGKRLILTNKNDLVPFRYVYGFPDIEYIGEFDILNDIKFYVEKKRNLITWSAAEDIGMILANVNAAAVVKP